MISISSADQQSACRTRARLKEGGEALDVEKKAALNVQKVVLNVYENCAN